MLKRDIDSLLSRGKNYVCQYITAHCYDVSPDKPQDDCYGESNLSERHLTNHDHRRVLQIVNHLLDPRNKESYPAQVIVEWLKYLISGRRLPNHFANEVKQFDTTSKCCLVWTDNFVAYRCRTCAISSCMSLCANCFLNGNHEGHDFNMFRSEAGGACDCGDSFVMKPEGFCTNHSEKMDECEDSKRKELPPNSLVCIPREVVPKLITFLVLSLRACNLQDDNLAKVMLSDLLIYLNDLGTLMQNILCDALINPNLYATSMKSPPSCDDDLWLKYHLQKLSNAYRKTVLEIQLVAILPQVEDPENIIDLEIIKSIESFQLDLVHNTFLDEIIFWTIMNEFPSGLVTFLLKMLPNEDYKIEFAKSFVKHYFRVSMLILYPAARFKREGDIFNNKLANSVIHVSVQLFSNKKLSSYLCEDLKLLYVIIVSLKYGFEGNRQTFFGALAPNVNMCNQTLLESRIEDKDRSSPLHYVVQCEHPILRYHRYWPIVSDLNNLFTHKEIAFLFLRDDKLIDLWLEFVMNFQTMNSNVFKTVIAEENSEFKAAFLAEFEICSGQMWTILAHLKDETTKDLTINFALRALAWLEKWFDLVGLDVSILHHRVCSFHLPLHRYYSAFVQHAVTVQKVAIETLLPIGDMERMKRLIAHPLQTIACYHHIMAGQWAHNGLSIKTQALNYTHPHFCNSTIDADIFLIQQAAAHHNPDIFIDYLATLCGLKRHMCLIPIINDDIELDRLTIMFENAFAFIASLATHRAHLGSQDTDWTRLEMITMLATSDKTHSQVHDQLPYKSSLMPNSEFIAILHDVSQYKSPEVAEVSGNLTQGYFYPKNEIWEKEYDPLMVLTRNALRKDFQTSLQRFADFARQNGKYSKSSLPWPPFRIPKQLEANSSLVNAGTILNSRYLHALFFVLLQNGLYDSPYVSQHLLSIVIYLMEMALIETSKRLDLPALVVDDLRNGGTINEMDFASWYPNEDLMANFVINFSKIQSLNISETSDGTNKSVKTRFMVKFLNTLIRDGIFNEDDCDDLNRNSTQIVEDDDSRSDDFVPDDEFEVELLQEEYSDTNENREQNEQHRDDGLQITMLPNDVGMSKVACASLRTQTIARHSSNDVSESSTSRPVNHNQADSDDDDDEDFDQEAIDNAKAAILEVIGLNENQNSVVRLNKIFEMNKKLMKRLIGSDRSSPWSTDDIEVEMDHSLLSLLLSLHSKFSDGKPDTFKTDSISLNEYDLNNRIGDGPHFIGCLLKRFILLTARRISTERNISLNLSTAKVIAIVDKTRAKLWPSLEKPSTSKACTSTIDTTSLNANGVVLSDRASPMLVDPVAHSDAGVNDLSQRRRTANERKQQILNQFKNMQKQFMENNVDHLAELKEDETGMNGDDDRMETTSGGADQDQEELRRQYQPQTYQCVICRDSGCSTTKRAFVQIVLLQSTSIIGNTLAHTIDEELDELESEQQANRNRKEVYSRMPLSDEDRAQFVQRKTYAINFEQKVDTSCATFSLESWLGSFNIGWCGGVHTQSCGHFMHIDCYQSFIESMYRTREPQPIDLFDYTCPCCRKSANSMLPIIPNFGNLYALVKSRTNTPNEVVLEILELLRNNDEVQGRLANCSPEETDFLQRLRMAIEDVIKVTEPQFRNIRTEPCAQSLFLFLSSIVRTNLEYLVMLWRSNLMTANQNRACFVPFFQALSVNAKLVLPMHSSQLWAQIAGIEATNSTMMPFEKTMPLILKDVAAILLQFLCALPFNIDKAYTVTLFQSLLNLNFVQALILIAFYLPEKKRIHLKARHRMLNRTKALVDYTCCVDYLGLIITNYDISFLNSRDSQFVENSKNVTDTVIEKLCVKLCLPFLRIATMLHHQLNKCADLPCNNALAGEGKSELEEWCTLSKYIGICRKSPSAPETLTFLDSINWTCNNPTELIGNWLVEFDTFFAINSVTAQNLFIRNFSILERPSLLSLPWNYEHLFLYYHNVTCSNCNTVPKEPCLCLICGQVICLRDPCCHIRNAYEGVTHSKACGASTAIYIAINSSTIIVVRGRKACIWGSVYLDEFGEEDRDLKRGKPLFLSRDRYRILEQQWLTHSFPYANKKWIYHKDLL